MQQPHASRNRGFTLLELLIVLGIITVLSVVLVVALNPAEVLRKSRDVQRLSDLANLKKALSLYVTTVSDPDLDASIANFCFAPGNTEAKIAYGYSRAVYTNATCPGDVGEGADVTAGSTFSTTDYCYSSMAAYTWSNIYQFSTTENPMSRGTWEYGSKTTITNPSLTTYTGQYSDACGGATLQKWSNNGGGTHEPYAAKQAGPGSATCSGITSLAMSTIVLHPASSVYSTLRWTAPATQTYLLSYSFRYTGFTTTDVHVVQNGSSIFDGVVDVGNQNQAASLTIPLTMGDTLDFVVGEGTGGATNDATFLSADIVPSSMNDALKFTDGTGWIPVNLGLLPALSPITSLPIDPVATNGVIPTLPSSSHYVYRYACQQTSAGSKPSRVFEIDAQLESAAYTQSEDKRASDGGDNNNYYEVGSSLRLIGTGTNF